MRGERVRNLNAKFFPDDTTMVLGETEIILNYSQLGLKDSQMVQDGSPMVQDDSQKVPDCKDDTLKVSCLKCIKNRGHEGGSSLVS